MLAFTKATLVLSISMGMAALGRAEAAWGLGPLGGANFANADIGGRDSRSITGWAFGARLEMGMLPFLGVMIDPMLVETGVKFNTAGDAIPGRGRFVNLEVPVLLNGRLDLAGIGAYAFIGPDLVFNTDASGNVVTEDDLSHSDARNVGLAGQVGAGLALGVAPAIEITADGRYSHGFTDLIEGAKGDIKHWHNRDVRLTLGVLLHTPRLGALLWR